MAKLVSKTYGEALFEIAMESGEDKAQELMEEILSIETVLQQNPEFDELMKHPGIPKQENLQVLKEVFKGSVSEELESFLEVVISKERYRDLSEIFSYFVDRVKDTKKIGVAYVTTAVELAESQKSAIESRLLETTSYKSMEMHYTVDTAIIGGMVVRINDRVVDSSVRTKLDGLKKQLLQIQLG